MITEKVAVVLFNLGGPDSLKSVKPFLFNLFKDKNIITFPNPFRYILAKFISYRRASKASNIYSLLGGKSPILKNTIEQSKALESQLSEYGNFKVFNIMRYWHPMCKEVVQDIMDYNPEKIILLPLYPQYSTSTTFSSIEDWYNHAKDIHAEIKTVCCYYNDDSFIQSYVDLILPELDKAKKLGKPIILFSAHGLPLRNIANGDPYKWQIEQSVNKIISKIPDTDYKICYQSRVGNLKWLSPYTEDEIKSAGREKKSVVLVPISFVSEHSETLVELDIEYKTLAIQSGVIGYFRVPTLGTDKKFIAGLASLCIKSIEGKIKNHPCPEECSKCFCRIKDVS